MTRATIWTGGVGTVFSYESLDTLAFTFYTNSVMGTIVRTVFVSTIESHKREVTFTFDITIATAMSIAILRTSLFTAVLTFKAIIANADTFINIQNILNSIYCINNNKQEIDWL